MIFNNWVILKKFVCKVPKTECLAYSNGSVSASYCIFNCFAFYRPRKLPCLHLGLLAVYLLFILHE